MIDLSNIKLDNKLKQSYNQFIKKDREEINFFWLGLQDYAPTLNLQKKIHKSIIQRQICGRTILKRWKTKEFIERLKLNQKLTGHQGCVNTNSSQAKNRSNSYKND